jgi:hypothetical protein
MKRIFATTLFMLSVCMAFCETTLSKQKPKIMVVPEDAFCVNAGFYGTDSKGNKIPDYTKAMLNEDVLDVINTFENLMAEYGFPLTDLQQALNDLKEESALTLTLQAKDDGVIVEDDLEKLSRIARADIFVKIAPVVSPYGPQRQIKLRVSAIDCASRKALQSFGPIVKTSAGSTAMLLKAAVTDNIESFVSGLSNYFTNLQDKGREGSIIIKVVDTCPLNLESDVVYEGEHGELADLITMWISDHAVNGAYTGSKSSRYGMKLDQVRFPLFGKAAFGKQKALSMEDFVKTGLTQLLSQYGISVSTYPIGIGKVYITLGSIQ